MDAKNVAAPSPMPTARFAPVSTAPCSPPASAQPIAHADVKPPVKMVADLHRHTSVGLANEPTNLASARGRNHANLKTVVHSLHKHVAVGVVNTRGASARAYFRPGPDPADSVRLHCSHHHQSVVEAVVIASVQQIEACMKYKVVHRLRRKGGENI